MSDRQRLLQALRDAGSRGITTFEIRRGGISGNPSERRRELLALGYLIEAEPCKEGHRRGKRFILTHDAGVGSGDSPSDEEGSLPASSPAVHPGARASAATAAGVGSPPGPTPRLFNPEPDNAALTDFDEAA